MMVDREIVVLLRLVLSCHTNKLRHQAGTKSEPAEDSLVCAAGLVDNYSLGNWEHNGGHHVCNTEDKLSNVNLLV